MCDDHRVSPSAGAIDRQALSGLFATGVVHLAAGALGRNQVLMPGYPPHQAHTLQLPDSPRLPWVDALRGLSILAVVLLHIDIRIPIAQSGIGALMGLYVSRVLYRAAITGSGCSS